MYNYLKNIFIKQINSKLKKSLLSYRENASNIIEKIFLNLNLTLWDIMILRSFNSLIVSHLLHKISLEGLIWFYYPNTSKKGVFSWFPKINPKSIYIIRSIQI